MKNIIEALRTYALNAFRSVLTHFSAKDDALVSSGKKYLKKGDVVEAKDGTQGRVWRVYRKIKTGKIAGCTIIWDTPYNGEKFSMLLPAEDKYPKFNPVIRKLEG